MTSSRPCGLEKMKVDDKGKGGIDSPKFGVTFFVLEILIKTVYMTCFRNIFARAAIPFLKNPILYCCPDYI